MDADRRPYREKLLDPRWQRVIALVASLKGRDGIPKEFRVQNLSMTTPTMRENLRQTKERVAAHGNLQPGAKSLDGYSDESAEQLLAFEGKYRTDSLVLAFERGISQKAEREGRQTLSDEERRCWPLKL